MSKDEGSATGDRVGVLEGNTEAVTFGDPPLLATRRLALGTAAAATAGFLADRALSPDSALAAEGVTSVNGKTGVVVLTADNVEAIPSVGVQAVATSNVATKGIPSKTLTDGVTLTEGQLVLLTAQTTASENGVWVVKGGTTKWTRPAAFATKSEQYSVLVPVFGGTKYGETMWLMKNASKVVVDTTAQVWTNLSRIEVTRGPGIAYVPPPTGVAATDTANIQMALNEGPGVCQLGGTESEEYVCNLLTIPTGVILAGRGLAGTKVKLAPSQNTALLMTTGFVAYAEQANKERKEVAEGKKSVSEAATIEGNVQGGIRDLTLDGNKTHNSAPASIEGVVSWFGRAHIFRDFWIEQAAGHGLVSNWGAGGVQMEALIDSFKIIGADSHGIVWNGPHDSSITNGNCIAATKYGLLLESYGATNVFNVHNWGETEYAIVVKETGAQLIGCQGEVGQSGTKTALWINAGSCRVVGGLWFNSAIGILLGESGKEIGGTDLNTSINETPTTCLKIAGNDWYGRYRLSASPANAELKHLYEGSFESNSLVQILSSQAPVLQIPVLTPITEPGETTKANTEAIKAILKTLGI